VEGCSRVGSRVAAPASVRTSRTVRVVGADCPCCTLWPRCSSCSSCVLERLCFDRVGQWFLVGRCLADRPPGRRGLSARHELLADRPRTWYGPSMRRGAGWVILFVFNEQSAVDRGPSAWCGQSTWVAAGQLSPLLRASPLGSFGVCS
jgi:hypothetical protein